MRSWPTCQTHWPRQTPPSGNRKSSSHRPQTTLLILTNHKRRLRVFDRHSSEAPIKPSIPLLPVQSERLVAGDLSGDVRCGPGNRRIGQHRGPGTLDLEVCLPNRHADISLSYGWADANAITDRSMPAE